MSKGLNVHSEIGKLKKVVPYRDIQNQAQLKMKSTFSHVKIFLLPPQIILRPALSQLSMYFTSFPESNLKTACHSTIMHP